MEAPSNPEFGIETLRQDICYGIGRILIVACSVYFFLYLSKGKIQESIPYLITILGGFVSLYLESKKKILVSRFLVLAFCNSLIFYSLVNTGYEHQAHIFLVILVATSFLLFEKNHLPLLNLFFVTVGHIICYTYFITYGPLNQGARIFIGEYLNFLLALFGAAYLSFQLFKDQKSHEQRNNDFLKEIQEKNVRLINKNEQLEHLIYITSHDLQEPLRNIQNMTNLVVSSTESKNEETREALKHLNQSTDQMSQIITGIMDYAKIGQVTTIEWVDVNALIAEVKADLAVQIKEADTIFQQSELPTILAYRSELRMLFQNLLSNAIKFRHPDRQLTIQISAEIGERYYTFFVKDNGIGMDEKHTKTIFHIFKKLHNKKHYRGTGIGLAHCKKIVELHEGNIDVELNNSFGSTFYFSIKRFDLSSPDSDVSSLQI